MSLQGDRRAGTAGPSLSEFNFESTWGQKALKHMYRAICEVTPSPEPALSMYNPPDARRGSPQRQTVGCCAAATAAQCVLRSWMGDVARGNAQEEPPMVLPPVCQDKPGGLAGKEMRTFYGLARLSPSLSWTRGRDPSRQL